MLSPVSSPLRVKNLGVDTDEGEGSGFSERKVVQGGRGFSSGGLPKLKPHHPEQVWRVAMGCGLQPPSAWALCPFHYCSGNGPVVIFVVTK